MSSMHTKDHRLRKNIEFSSPKFSCLIGFGEEDKNRFLDRKQTDQQTDKGKLSTKNDNLKDQLRKPLKHLM